MPAHSLKLLDLLGITSLALISLQFYFVRRRLWLYGLAAGAVLCLTALIEFRFFLSASAVEGIALLVGIALYSFGLLTVRIMLRRSVSLYMLSWYIEGREEPEVRAQISSRLDDARAWKLVALEGGTYRLTVFGKLVALSMRLCYRVLRVRDG